MSDDAKAMAKRILLSGFILVLSLWLIRALILWVFGIQVLA